MTDQRRVDTRTVVDLVVDRGTWQSWDGPADPGSDESDYGAARDRARDRTGVDESVVTGCGLIGGHRVAMVISEFGFLGGSIGRAAGQRVVAAVERATRERIAVLALPSSGGTRMQEGTPAFLQMVAITGAVNAHKAAGLAYLVYLRHPTTGGVFASWGSLGHITWAQPSALVGFLGPRVYEGLYGEPFPAEVQTSENLLAHGLVDAVFGLDRLGSQVGRLLALLAPVAVEPVSALPDDPPMSDAWSAVVATRSPGRPGLAEVLGPDHSVVLRGDAPIWLALSRFGGRTAVVVGQDRVRQAAGQLIGPADLRVARRGMAMAADLRLPVVTIIDTPGAELSVDAEQGGLSGEIARCTSELVQITVPTVSVLLGQGAGGAALALFPADTRIAAADAWLSPLPPEGASVIVHHDTVHAAELADHQGIAAAALSANGTVDRIVDVTADGGVRALRSVVAEALATRTRPSMRRRTRTPGADR